MIATAKMFLATAIPGRPRLPGEAEAGPVLPRQPVSLAELIAAVNQQLSARGDCDGLEVEAPASMRPGLPDADGCNWSPSALRLRMAHGPSTRALSGLRHVVEWARLNLELTESAG